MSSYFFRVVVAVLASTFAVLGQVRCASAQVPYLEPLDPSRRHLFGQHYNPEKYRACLNQIRGADIQCDYLRLRRKEQPEYWPNPNVPRPKLPDPPSPPVYREGMTSKQYFDALCKAEAGEFIYQTVDSVQGVYQIRPRVSEEGNAEQQDRYVMEDPFGYGSPPIDTPRQIGFYLTGLGRYQFVEIPAPPLGPNDQAYRSLFHPSMFFPNLTKDAIYRLSGYDSKSLTSLRAEILKRPSAKYAITWRGIVRPKDREMAIAGGELIVLRLKDNAILAIRRGFLRSGFSKSRDGIWWGNAEACPNVSAGLYGARPFLFKVLRPSTSDHKP